MSKIQNRFAFFSLCCFLFSNTLFAAGPEIGLTVEPTVGYSMSKKSNPDRTLNTVTYGAKASVGLLIFAAEAEYNRGQTTEDLTAPVSTEKQLIERYRLGLRSDMGVSALGFFRLRGGAEGRKSTTDTTTAGVTTRRVSPFSTYPYVGAGVGMNLGTMRVTAEVTATILDKAHLKNAEITPSLSVVLGF